MSKVQVLGIDVNKTKRVHYLDMLKCLGMFIVVQGHIHPNYGWFSLPIHSFVIPLYFFLSGLTFRRSKYPSFKTFFKHRLKTLMLPYAMFSVVTWLFWAGFNYLLNEDVNYVFPLLQTIFAQGSGKYLIHNVPLWFIPCLFVIECIYYWIDKLSKRKYIFLSLIISAFIGIWMINGSLSYIFHRLPWSIEGAFIGVVFYGCANLIVKKTSLKEISDIVLSQKTLAIIVIIIVSITLVFSSYYNGHISIGSDLLGKNPLLFYINAFMGILSITLFSIIVCSIKVKTKLMEKIMNFHYWFGKNSFYIMATHVPIKGVLILGIAKVIHQTKSFVENDYFWCVFVFIITCAISSAASVIIGRMKKNDELLIKKIRAKFTHNEEESSIL